MRLFVAVYPPAPLAEAWQRALGAAQALPLYTLTKPEQVHLTVLFVGEVDDRERRRVEESFGLACRGIGPFTLRPRRLITLPSKGPARVIAVETDAPSGLLELHRRLVQRLANPAKQGDRDGFLPHLTIARFPGMGTRCVDLGEAEVEPVPFPVSRVDLVRSVLTPTGAQHNVVASSALNV